MAFLKAAALALTLLFAVSSTSDAQTSEARIVVPDAPSGAFVAGCY